MRTRLTYLALRPSTPRLIAQRLTELAVLVAGIIALVLVSTGTVSHVLFSGIVAVAGGAA